LKTSQLSRLYPEKMMVALNTEHFEMRFFLSWESFVMLNKIAHRSGWPGSSDPNLVDQCLPGELYAMIAHEQADGTVRCQLMKEGGSHPITLDVSKESFNAQFIRRPAI
jgi:hypothetical protein